MELSYIPIVNFKHQEKSSAIINCFHITNVILSYFKLDEKGPFGYTCTL